MSQSVPHIPEDQRSVPPSRRRYTDAFKQQAARLVTHERYTMRTAAEAVGVSERTLRKWVAQARPAVQPCGPNASIEQLQAENRQLRQQLKRAEIEREILKKATAYFAKEST